jgi:hypothetical protein
MIQNEAPAATTKASSAEAASITAVPTVMVTVTARDRRGEPEQTRRAD